MSEISIGTNHLAQLQQIEHVGMFLQGEAARLEAELAYVRRQEAALAQQVQGFLLQGYGITPGSRFTLDTARALIITDEPDIAPPASSTPAKTHAIPILSTTPEVTS